MGMRWKLPGIAAALLLAAPSLADVPIDPGEPATIHLSPQGDLAFPVAPPRPHAPANYGAILSVDIDEPGRYHVAIGAPGWIDMIRDGTPLTPTGDRPGAAGSGVAKILDYDLVIGRYTLTLSGMTAGAVSVAISH